MKPKSLYVNRPLLNSEEVRAWAKSQGFSSTLAPDDMHVTICFSKEAFNWNGIKPQRRSPLVKNGDRSVEQFDDAVVLTFTSPELEARHQSFLDAGASFDFDTYHPHITITYDGAPDDLEAVQPYDGKLLFGPEEFSEVVDDWKDGIEEDAVKRMLKMDPGSSDVHANSPGWKKPKRSKKTKRRPVEAMGKVLKVDSELGVVFGWALVCDVAGVPYFDTQGDHIPQEVMLKAATSFMADLRVGKEMHVGEQKGSIVFAWPMTSEIAKAMGVDASMTGMMIGFKPDDKAILKKYQDGDYTGFSIGGMAKRAPIEEDDDNG